MLKNLKNRVNEAGSLMVEMLAMLGLLAMVTPVVYKKSAERITEIQDINAANEMRSLIKAVDAYLKDNYQAIVDGGVVTRQVRLSSAKTKNFRSELCPNRNADGICINIPAGGLTATVPLAHLEEYLPYGFLDDTGNVQGSKTFNSNYQVVIKKMDTAPDDASIRKRMLTGFVIAQPNAGERSFDVRGSRISSMIGANGGFAFDANEVMGAQGIWGVTTGDFAGATIPVTIPAQSVVASSVQPISSPGDGDIIEDVLYRKDMRPKGRPELNTMETTLGMGTWSIHHINQLMIRAGVQTEPDYYRIGGDQLKATAPQTKENDALYIEQGGANIQGRIFAVWDGDMDRDGNPGANGVVYDDTDGTDEDILDAKGDPTGMKRKVRTEQHRFTVDTEQLQYRTTRTGQESGRLLVTQGLVEIQATEDSGPGEVRVSGHERVWLDTKTNTRIHMEDEKGLVDKPSVEIAADTGNILSTAGENIASEAGKHMRLTVNDSAGTLRGESQEIILTTGDLTDAELARKDNIGAAATSGGVPFSGSGNEALIMGENAATPTLTSGTRGVELRGNELNVHRQGSTQTGATNKDTFMTMDDWGIAIKDTIANEENVSPYAALGEYDADGFTGGVSVEGIDMQLIARNRYTMGAGIAAQKIADELFTDAGDIKTYSRHSVFMSAGSTSDDLDIYDKSGMTEGEAYFQMFGSDGKGLVRGASGLEEGTAAANAARMEMYARNVVIEAGRDNEAGAESKIKMRSHAKGAANPTDRNNRSRIEQDAARVDVGYTYNSAEASGLDGGASYRRIMTVDSLTDREETSKGRPYGTGTGLENEVIRVKTGVIEIGRRAEAYNTASVANADTPVSYVKADRLVANVEWENNNIPSTAVGGTPSRKYDEYQVNPAYTSVMHDIKLTTRGGARLSDILPDFINKGIYMADNNYQEGVKWLGSDGKTGIAPAFTSSTCNEFNCPTSPWLGFVPTPICPPEYSKVVTNVPAYFAMAQAGVPTSSTDGTLHPKRDLMFDYHPKNPHEFMAQSASGPNSTEVLTPLYFQKNTWLKAEVVPFSESGGAFHGWHAIMGFIYPVARYCRYIKETPALKISPGLASFASCNENQASDKMIWNLFPVYPQELGSYATVYCYFDRGDYSGNRAGGGASIYDPNYVQRYIQRPIANGYKANAGTGKPPSDAKETGYKDRLNDPNLKYDDPW